MESQLHIKFDNIRSETKTKTKELENTFPVVSYGHGADRLPDSIAAHTVAGDRFMSDIHPVEIAIPAVRGAEDCINAFHQNHVFETITVYKTTGNYIADSKKIEISHCITYKKANIKYFYLTGSGFGEEPLTLQIKFDYLEFEMDFLPTAEIGEQGLTGVCKAHAKLVEE